MKFLLERPLQNDLIIQFDSTEIGDFLRQVYQPCVSELSKPNDIIGADIIIEKGRIRSLDLDPTCDYTACSMDALFLQLERVIDRKTTYSSHVVAFHGAAVEHNNMCILLLSPTHRGKSTLVTYLTANGDFGFVTDDCILVDKTSTTVHPYTVPIKLRYINLFGIRQFDLDLDFSSLCTVKAGFHNLFLPPRIVREKLKIERIYWICYDEKSKNNIITLSKNTKILSLMTSTLVEYSLTKEYIHFLETLAEINCYFVEYSDLRFAKASIMSMTP